MNIFFNDLENSIKGNANAIYSKMKTNSVRVYRHFGRWIYILQTV